jgi:hypothetical protein
MSLKLTLGDLTIHRLIEQETTFLPALDMLPGLTPELLAENRAWMRKANAIDDNDVLILCFQSYIVDTAPYHSGRQLHRQRQAAAAAAEMEHEDRRISICARWRPRVFRSTTSTM